MTSKRHLKTKPLRVALLPTKEETLGMNSQPHFFFLTA